MRFLDLDMAEKQHTNTTDTTFFLLFFSFVTQTYPRRSACLWYTTETSSRKTTNLFLTYLFIDLGITGYLWRMGQNFGRVIKGVGIFLDESREKNKQKKNSETTSPG